MKFLILFVTVFSMSAWSQEESVVNPADPNLKIGMNNRFEADVNEPYVHPNITRELTGDTAASCPSCGPKAKLWNNTTFSRDSNNAEEGKKADGQQ